VKLGRPAISIAFAYMTVELLLVTLLPGQFAWVGVSWVVLAELAASYACFREARKAQHEGRVLWRLMAFSILLAPLSAFLLIWLELRGTAAGVLFPGLMMLLNTLYGAALLLTVTLQFDPRVLRPLREMSAFLSAAIAALCFVMVYSVSPMRGLAHPLDLRFVTQLL
jgi:hypothetical protein